MGAKLLAITRRRWHTAGVFTVAPRDDDSSPAPVRYCKAGHPRPADYLPGDNCLRCSQTRTRQYARGYCPVCGRSERMRADGTMRPHRRRTERVDCRGSRKPAQSAVGAS